MHINLISSGPYPEFEVYDEKKLIIHLKIDREMNSFRILCGDNRRVFFIVEEKYRRNSVYSLVNEYSQPLGAVIKDKFLDDSGEIEIEGLRLNYRIARKPVREIVLLENDKTASVLNCRVNDALARDNNDDLMYFIFALSWFVFLSKEKKEVAELTEA